MGESGVDAEVPDGSGEKVFPGMEGGREVESLVAPVRQIAGGGAGAAALPVHVEDEAAICADVHEVVGRNGGQRYGLAEMQHEGFAEWRGGVRDPLRGPLPARLPGDGG